MPWRTVAAATAAVLVGIGLARFAYSPLLPVVIGHGWFSPGQAAYLGAANLLGYLVGALVSRRLGGALGLRPALRLAMMAASASLLACCAKLPFAWFFAWRLVSGIAGGVLMILGPPAILPLVPAHRRGLASGLVFTGIGLGIAASGTLVPLLLRQGLTAAWLGLGLAALLLTAITWRQWPQVAMPPPVGAQSTTRFGAISLSYGLCAIGLVPHMVFLVDYVARGQGRGLAAGNLTWVVFGLGAISGPVVLGRISDRIGALATFRLAMLLEAAAIAGLLLRDPALFGVMAFGAGLLVPGMTAVMLGRVQEVAGADPTARQRGWTEATVAWAIGQAAAAYGLAWLYARTGGYAAVLAVAGGAVGLAALVELWMVAARPGLWRPKPVGAPGLRDRRKQTLF